MSSSLEYNSAEVFSELEEASDKEQSSHPNPVNNSEEDPKSEEGSLDSLVTREFYTSFPMLLQFQKPDFLKRNFRDPEEALCYINEKFHIDKIHNDL